MKSFTTNLITALTIGAVALAGSNALAGDKGKGGGNGGGNGNGKGKGNGGGFSVSFGGGNNGHHHDSFNYYPKQHCHSGGYYSDGGIYSYNQNYPIYISQAYEPFHSTCIVLPGDSFYTISLKEYGTSVNSQKIAQFNRLPLSAALVPGQRLVLPSISATGQMSPSRMPAAEEDMMPVQFPSNPPTAKFAPTTVPMTIQVVSEPLPTIAVGSLVSLDGQMFGNDKGTVRLNVGGTPLPVEIVEWTVNSAKVRLPQLNVSAATKAELEVVRADGSLASKSAIELTPATGLALGK